MPTSPPIRFPTGSGLPNLDLLHSSSTFTVLRGHQPPPLSHYTKKASSPRWSKKEKKMYKGKAPGKLPRVEIFHRSADLPGPFPHFSFSWTWPGTAAETFYLHLWERDKTNTLFYIFSQNAIDEIFFPTTIAIKAFRVLLFSVRQPSLSFSCVVVSFLRLTAAKRQCCQSDRSLVCCDCERMGMGNGAFKLSESIFC